MFIYNAWYVVAWQAELQRSHMLGRVVLGEPIVLIRTHRGDIHALEDRCPHRHVPLSVGTLRDDKIECAYHGLRFGTDGRCTHNPYGENIPRNAKVRVYPVVVRDDAVWIWLGEGHPTEGPPTFRSLDRSTHHVATDQLVMKASYLLAIDNILDLSHLEFLHASTLGSAQMRNGLPEIEESGTAVRVTRQVRSEELSKMLQIAYQLPPNTTVDRLLDVHWRAPAAALVEMSVRPSRESSEAAWRKIDTYHFFTPQTEGSCHYFFAASIAHGMQGYGESAIKIGLRALRQPFEKEDSKMLEAQQELQDMGTPESCRPVVLPGDAASNKARAILKRMFEEEGAAAREQRQRGPSPFQGL